MTEPAVRAINVSYATGATSLLRNVSMRAQRGELVAICGPNGAGKTTLLRLLAGDLQPTVGEISIDGTDTARVPLEELSRHRSVMRQSSRPDIPFTVLSVVGMGRYPHRREPGGSAEADALAIKDAMRRTETIHLAPRIFATLSGGEQTRVVLARVLAQEAPVVLLDEPTAALDVAHQEAVLTELRAVADAGGCVIAVLHDLNAASYYADRIVLMAEGAVVTTGTPGAVLERTRLSETYGRPMMVTTHPTRSCPLVLVE